MKFIGQNIYDQISLFRDEVRILDPSGTSTLKIISSEDVNNFATLTTTTQAGGGGQNNTVLTAAGTETSFEIVADEITLDPTNTIALEGATTVTGNFTVTGDTVTFQSANADDPQVAIKNTNSNTSGAELHLVKDKGAAGADGDEIGIIKFIGDDAGQNQTLFGHIEGSIATAAHLSEGGAIKIAVASHDGEMQNGLQIIDGNVEDEVDVTIANGTASNTTIAGNLIVTSDLTVSGTTTTIDTTNLNVEDNNITLNYNATGDTSSTANGAGITIQDAVDASNNASLTWIAASDQFQFSHSLTSLTVDSIQLDGEVLRIDKDPGNEFFIIEVVAEGATTLTTNDNDGTAGHFEIAADGNITLDAAGGVAVEAAGGTYSNDATVVSFSNSQDVDFANTNTFDISSTEGPAVGITGTTASLTLKHTTNDAESSILNFSKDRGAAAAADNDFLGQVFFIGEDDAENATTYASITAQISESKNTDEAGKLTLSVAESDGTTTALSPGLILEGEHATDGEVDVTIANGAASTTTIAGTLTMGSTAAINNSGVIQVAAQTVIDHDQLANFAANEHFTQANITTVGTISTGVWNGTAIASAYLDADTAHLTTAQTFTGAKTFGTTTKLQFRDANAYINSPDANDLEIAATDITLDAAGTVTVEADDLVINSTNANDPLVNIINDANDSTSGRLRFLNRRGADGQDNDETGIIEFFSFDDGTPAGERYSRIIGTIHDATAGQESGKLTFQVASHDGEDVDGLVITGGDAEDVVDVTIGNIATSTTTIAGDATVTSKLTAKTRKFEVSSATDGDYGGDVVYFGGTTSMTTGAIYHYKSDGTWELADADAASTSDGLLGVALGAASDTNGVLLRGMVTIDHDPGAIGDVLYLSTTGGDCSATAPSGNGDIVRIIGYQVSHASNGNIWFNPDGTFVEISA